MRMQVALKVADDLYVYGTNEATKIVQDALWRLSKKTMLDAPKAPPELQASEADAWERGYEAALRDMREADKSVSTDPFTASQL